MTLGHVPKVAVAGCGISICHSAQYMALVTHLYFLPGPAPCSGKLLGKLPVPAAPGGGFCTQGGSLCPAGEKRTYSEGGRSKKQKECT